MCNEKDNNYTALTENDDYITMIDFGDYNPTQEDIKVWREMFEEAEKDKDFKIFTHQGVKIKRLAKSMVINQDENSLTIIKLGTENWLPTPKDLENWRDLFNSAMCDKNFKVFEDGKTVRGFMPATIEKIPIELKKE